MTWKDLISGSFGFGNASFAAFPADLEFASQAVRAAKAEGITREEFAREIAAYPRKYIRSEQELRQRLSADSAMLDKIWKVPVALS